MVDITHKNNTLREATAQALLRVGSQKTIDAIKNRQVPKGDVFEMSRAAGLLGVKKTPELLPDCHPLPIEYTHFEYEISGLDIKINCTLKTIYKTGVEVEAMHGASIVALNMYDMLKPLDKEIEIAHIKLLKKTGGKSNLHKVHEKVKAAVIVCSDSVSAGKKEDHSGKAIQNALKGWEIPLGAYHIIPDEIKSIQDSLCEMQEKGHSIILFTGGTGLSPRDVTPEALTPLLDKSIPGMEEAIRNYGQNRTPYAMLSRSVVGLYKGSLVIALPGSTNGALESLNALFPAALHLFDITKGAKHEK